MKYLIILILVWIVIVYALIHLGWYLPIRNEKKNKKKSVTTNGKSYFVAKVDDIKGNKITGTYKGTLPDRGNVLYIKNGTSYKIIFIRKVKKYDENRVELKVFGLNNFELKDSTFLTNKREEPIKEELINEFNYPIIIKTPVRSILMDLFIIFVGSINILLSLYGLTKEIKFIYIFILIVGSLISLLGLYILINQLLFKIYVREDKTMNFKQLFKNKAYDLKDIIFKRIVKKADSELYELYLYDKEGKLITKIDENYKNYNELRSLLIKINHDKNIETIGKYIEDREFYVPVESEIMLFKKGNDLKVYFAYNSIDYLKEDFDDYINVNIEKFIEEKLNDVDVVILWIKDDNCPLSSFEINKETFDEIKKRSH